MNFVPETTPRSFLIQSVVLLFRFCVVTPYVIWSNFVTKSPLGFAGIPPGCVGVVYLGIPFCLVQLLLGPTQLGLVQLLLEVASLAFFA